VSVVAPPPPVDRPSRRRRTGARLLHLLAWAGVLGLTGMAVLRLFGVDGSALTAGLLSLTPYAAAAGPVVLAVAALARARVAVAVTVALIALNVVWLVPRYTAEHLPAATAPRLRVMSANLYFGDADPGSVVAAVRAQRPDVLTLIEVDRAGLAALDRDGLAGLLPHRIVRFAPGAGGTAILSRLGLRDLGEAGPTAYRSPRALVFVGDRVVAVQAGHTRPPIPGPTGQWRRDLALLAGPPAESERVPLVMLGDFNASADHPAFRRLLASGLRDAHDARGRGLVRTWPASGGRVPPLVQLDHVLVSGELGVATAGELNLPGTDHRAVYAELAFL
jgi:endonuclease/exonuclease/phosphatase (EEP) superfamily protein YafD